ncbi:heavy metal translocating P-type ATPase [Microbacterium sp.]|uniref:heavy metal translocating P-type ATPase n=1 Tax=Microbacterium sp. TaxID=51671 RepID=UPI0028AFB4B2|nr:heavy metal translocating P-type ATPase [Microbacterium sp.]
MRLLRLARRYPLLTAGMLTTVVVALLSLAGLHEVARWIAILVVGAVIAITAWDMVRDILRAHFGLDILALIAMIATLLVGEYIASLVIVLMLSGGEALEDYASRRAARDLTALLDRSPQTAHVLDESADSAPRDVPVDEVVQGMELLVRPSEIVPVDGVLLSAHASFDESSLTGESVPVSREAGDEVLSGVVNGSNAVRIRTLRRSADSQYQQIIALVHEAQESKAPTVRLADRFAVPFTLVSLLIAGIAWWIAGDPLRFAQVLVLATPCPLLIAAPVAFLGGLSRSAKEGVIVKGGGVIEQLARVRSAAFDKTGTLTQGRPELIEVRAAGGVDADEVLRLAASAEQYSSHVLAEGVRRAAVDRGLRLAPAAHAEEIATNGVTATIEGRVVVVGKPAYVASLAPDTRRTELASGQLAAYVAIDGRFAGALVLADAVRPDAAAVVEGLRQRGIERIVMLTGDADATAAAIAAPLGVNEVHAELLPGKKVSLAAEMTPRPLLMVGDGVNDAPVLAAADIGVAMGARGSTAAGEAADAVVLKDSLLPVLRAVDIGRHTLRVAYAAIWIGIVLSVGLMLIAATGIIPAVAGAFIQELVDLATILYALRALTGPKSR